jgi:hypothetical protein
MESVYTLKRNGGGIYAYIWDDGDDSINVAKVTVSGSTVDNNDAYEKGGGIFFCSKHHGQFVVINSTLSGNQTTNQSAGAGGGIYIAHPAVIDSVDAYLRNVTVTQNISKTGGGVATLDFDDVRVRIANSIISENFDHLGGDNNLVGRVDIASTKYNLVGSGSTILNLAGAPDELDMTNITDEDEPMLGVLANNGGPTPTHRLQAGSPAIDAGSNDFAKHPLTNQPLETDQRGEGFPRIFDLPGGTAGPVDIGAYEIGLAKVIDVLLSGSSWMREPYSYAEIVPTGKQLAPIYTQGVDTIEIRFSEDVIVQEDALTLLGTNVRYTADPLQIDHTGFSPYDPLTGAVAWGFNILGGDKYRIDLDATMATGPGGNLLDGEWQNLFVGPGIEPDTPDNFADDPTGRPLRTGEGMAGGAFQFLFSLLPGDYNQDGIVDAADEALWHDVDGDGNNQPGQPGDHDVWYDHFEDYLPYLFADRGDYHDDDRIDGNDYLE